MTASVAVSREYVEIWRTKDCAAFEAVYADENGVICSELMVWHGDGGRYREVIGGVDLTTTRRDWEAASPAFGAVLVPNDAGKKVWTHLEPEPELVPERPATPAPVAEPAAPPVSRDPQYEPWKAPRDTPRSRALSWGPGWDL